ncbi:MAG: hypothetical protein ACFB2Y_04070 [Fulvivirga sp.]
MQDNKSNKRDVHFKKVWGDSAESGQVIDFWNRLRALPKGEDALKRSEQIVFVAKHENQIIGVTTAHPIKVSKLNNNYFYNFRVLIDPEFRAPGLVDKLCVLTREFLSENREYNGVSCVGMITLVQNEYLKKFRNEMVWPSSGFTYIGKSNAGHHIRILYFDRAYI